MLYSSLYRTLARQSYGIKSIWLDNLHIRSFLTRPDTTRHIVPKKVIQDTPKGYELLYYSSSGPNVARTNLALYTVSVLLTIVPLGIGVIGGKDMFIKALTNDSDLPYYLGALLLHAFVLMKSCGKFILRIYQRVDEPTSFKLITVNLLNPLSERRIFFTTDDIKLTNTMFTFIFGTQLTIRNRHYIINRREFVSMRHHTKFFKNSSSMYS